MKPGKLPPELLAELLTDVGAQDPRVVVGPTVGEDCAVVDMGDRSIGCEVRPDHFRDGEGGLVRGAGERQRHRVQRGGAQVVFADRVDPGEFRG